MATSQTILVGKESYLYLDRISREQRGCKPLTPDQEDRLWSKCRLNADGLRSCNNYSLGGGDGTYHGRWWSWSVDTLKKMLDEANLPYEDGEPIEYINVHL